MAGPPLTLEFWPPELGDDKFCGSTLPIWWHLAALGTLGNKRSLGARERAAEVPGGESRPGTGPA